MKISSDTEDAIRTACAQQVQAAFNLLVQSVLKRDASGVKIFVDSIALLELVRDQALKALELTQATKPSEPVEHPADTLKRELDS